MKLSWFFSSTFVLTLMPSFLLAQSAAVRLPHHVPTELVAQSRHLGRLNSEKKLTLSMALAVPGEAQMDSMIRHLHNPNDPLYGQFLTTDQFADQFAIPATEYNSVVEYLQSQGLKTTTHANRLFVSFEGNVSQIENSFQLEMHRYLNPKGREVFAPNANPLVSAAISSKVKSVIGLNNFREYRPSFRRPSMSLIRSANFTGSGPNADLLPADIRKAYNVNSAYTGTGQTLALIEFDSYTASDISYYASSNGIPAPNLANVLVDTSAYSPTPLSNSMSGAPEVTLDIDMMMALAPGAKQILVYEGPNFAIQAPKNQFTDANWLDTFSKVASDNKASVVSCSWSAGSDGGATSAQVTSDISSGENTVLAEMAMQGQSFFVASGDSGAYGDDSYGTSSQKLSVQDPGSQPYAISVGGTKLSLNSDGSYAKESSWGNGSDGGGGGISTIWKSPVDAYQNNISWQALTANTQNMGSSTMRNVPDVSLNSDQNTGYAIYFGSEANGTAYSSKSGYITIGGTSAAAPLWAAFTATVNQARAAAGLTAIGFMNPSLYLIGQSSIYNQCFHDVNDGSTNLYYPAVTGYDLSTGWGSFNASGLLTALSNPVQPPAPPTSLKFQTVSGASQ